MIDYIYYRTANNTKVTTWEEIFNKFISISPLSISSYKSGSISGNSSNGNGQSDSRSITIYKVKKNDYISITMSLSGSISKDGIVYISYNGGGNKILDQNFNGTRNHSMTSNYDYIKLTVYSSISNWSNGTYGSATSSVSATYHGSYNNFIA